MILRSPLSGQPLSRDGHALGAVGERWPVIDDIAFLRADRRELADRALASLDTGDHETALMLLLGDQDNWARTPPPAEAARREVIRRRDELTFREAMDLLAFGPVGTYFAHRWSDPTFLSGLALAQSHWSNPRRVVEVACGTGHYLRAFAPHAEVTGGDLVFAKLWLARHFVTPSAALVCFDAAAPWPIEDNAADLAFCHDAFYFLPGKPHIAREMRRVAPTVLVGHAHNALVETLSSGEPLSPAGYAALFPGAVLYDDRELTLALVQARVPQAATADELHDAPAVTLTVGAGPAGLAAGELTAPSPGIRLRRNPLYAGGRIAWPSDRYRVEYGSLVTYPASTDAPETALAGSSSTVDAMARNRVLLDLPERW